MGVKNAGRLMHHSPPLKSEEFVIGLSLFANSLGISGELPIAIDASWVGHSYHTSKKAAGLQDSSQHLADLCRTLASLGFAVTVVLDGKHRHHSKRASVQRKAKATKACIKARTLHSQILLMTSKIEDAKDASISTDDRNRLLEERKNLSAQLTSAERYSLPFNSSEFEKKTIDLLLGDDKQFGNGSVTVIRAAYQADSVIAQGLLTRKYAIVFGNDSDFSFLSLGSCIQVTKFSLKKKQNKSDRSLFQISNVTVSSLNKDLIATFLAKLPGSHPYTVIPAKDDITKFLVNLGPKTMSLIAVCLGCDQVPKGLPGFGVSRAVAVLSRIQGQRQPCPPCCNDNTEITDHQTKKEADEEFYNSLFVLLKEDYPKVSECYWECIDTCRMAFMFEPCNTVNYIGDTLTPAYHHPITCYVHSSPPAVLPRYLHDFAIGQEEISIVDGPCLSNCVGPGDGPHQFMDSEMCYDCQGTKMDTNGSVVCQMVHCRKLCSKCFRAICLDCRETQGNQHLCLECHGVEAVVPTPQEDQSTNTVMIMAPITTMNQLRAELELAGFDVSKDATRIELMELHEELVSQRKLSLFDMQSVKYPMFSSDTLDFPSSRFESILEFDFKDGGRFIRDDRLDSNVVVELLDLLSRYVEFSSGKVASKKEYQVHHVLPDIIIEFAEGSRLDYGYRLLQRCVRHSSDSKMPSIEDSTCRVVRVTKQRDNNDVVEYNTGLMITTKVPPSFKTEAPYGVQVLICSEGIAACRCSCKAGSHGCNRHVDVHILPVLYQLTLFLIECLAEHLLYELGQWIKDSGRCLSKDQEQLLFTAVTKLLKACKTPTAEYEIAERNSTSKLTTILEMFAVGTEQARRGCPPPPDRRDLRPLRHCTFENPVTKFKRRLNAPKVEESSTLLSSQMDSRDAHTQLDQQEPDYVGLHFILEELVRRMHVISPGTAFNRIPFVGYQLLDLRRIHFCKDNDVDETKELIRAHRTVDSIMEVGCTERVALARGRVGRPPLVSNVTTNKKCPKRKKRVANLNVVSTRLTEKAIEKKIKKALARGDRSKYCCVPACRTRHNRNTRVVSGDIKMYYLPLLKKKPTDGAREKVWYNYAMSLGLRKELKQRGFRLESTVTRYICCTDHELEEVKRSLTITMVQRKNKDETKRTFNFLLRVPKTTETSKAFTNAPITVSKGLGTDRALERIGKQLHQSVASLSPGDKRDALLSRMEIQKLVELSDSKNRIDCLINKRVQNSFGLTDTDEDQQERDHNTSTTKKARICVVPIISELETDAKKVDGSLEEPVVHLHTSDQEVKERTGFINMCHLVSFVAIACNGDATIMVEKVSTLTWLEEWFYYFELVWGRSLHRDVDAAREYLVSGHTLRKVAVHKQRIISNARNRWPRFALHEDDVILRGKRWNDRYRDLRVNMWDTTDLKLMFKPSDPDYQRLTYLLYYGKNVGKGGVCVQLCGWITTEELWTGAISDTEYLERSGILSTQQHIGGEKSFVNIVDKGFRNVVAAWRHGHQIILQPAFAKSDRRFTSYELISSAAIAADRSANERAVKVCKRSGFLERGLRPGGDVEFFSETWRNWAFQVNFMFKPVL